MRPRAWLLWLAAVALLAAAPCVRPLDAQAPTVVAFDDEGRLREITPGIADRLGLRPPSWPVEGEYRRVVLLRAAAGSWSLEVQRFDGTVTRVPLTDEQAAALRLEVGTRAGAIGRSGGRVVEAAPLVADAPISRRAFVWRETILGAGLFGPLAWTAVDSRAFSPSAYLFTAAGSFLLATNAINRAPVGTAQTDIGTLGALGGAAGAATLAWSLGNATPRERATAAFVGGVGLHVAALAWGRGASSAEARGTAYGAAAGALVASGVLGAARVFETATTGREKLTGGVLASAALAGAPIGRAYVRNRPHRVTDGDVGAVALAGGLGAVLGLGIAGGTTAPDAARFGGATALGVAGLVAGDRWLARPYDHDAADLGTLLVGTAAGAVIAAAPYRLAGRTDERTTILLAAVGGLAGLWGGEVVTRPRAGTRTASAGLSGRTEANASAPASRRAGLQVRLDPAAAVFATLRAPGMFPVVRVTF